MTSLFECPDCGAQQPERGPCGRCPGYVRLIEVINGNRYVEGVDFPFVPPVGQEGVA